MGPERCVPPRGGSPRQTGVLPIEGDAHVVVLAASPRLGAADGGHDRSNGREAFAVLRLDAAGAAAWHLKAEQRGDHEQIGVGGVAHPPAMPDELTQEPVLAAV